MRAHELLLQNEKRKDKELTLRIERILKLRDEAIKGVDLSRCFQYNRLVYPPDISQEK